MSDVSQKPAAGTPMLVLAFAACTLIWGSTWVVIPLQLGTTPEAWSVAIRFAIAATLLFALSRLRRKPLRLAAHEHRAVAVLGLCLFSANYTIIYHGSGYLTSGLVAVAFSTLAIFNIANGRLWLARPVLAQEIVAAALGALGLVLIFWPEVESFSAADDTLLGLALVLLATFIASLGNTALASARLTHRPVLVTNAWGMLYGTLFNVAFALIDGRPFVLDTGGTYWAAMAYLSVMGTVVTFTLYTWLISAIGVARAGYMAVMTPLVALALSVVFEGLVLGLLSLLGLLCIITGNLVINRVRRIKA